MVLGNHFEPAFGLHGMFGYSHSTGTMKKLLGQILNIPSHFVWDWWRLFVVFDWVRRSSH